ncbi:MAG TPA: DNA topoisomerase VI subunit B [Candidatus Poseidoniales archaeon]|nr:DNA topoisomerase VI subunit B [Candidatus Poseidoniales archaeon]
MVSTRSKMQQASISEFFEKNKHFLGFDTLNRSIITATKESVDNSLDACEEARLLPDIHIEIRKVKGKSDELVMISQDNGPGIPPDSITKVFGSLLFGSRFHTIRQTRGQQGIGITGVVMYSQLTTGKKTRVISKVKQEATAVYVDIGLDTKKNKAISSNRKRNHWFNSDGEIIEHGVKVQAHMKAKYQRGKQSVHQYLRMTSIVNPHASLSLIVYDEDGAVIDEGDWPRVTDVLPHPVKEIRPHPHGQEIGSFQRFLRDSVERKMTSFLRHNFSGVSMRAAREILLKSEIDESRKPGSITAPEAQAMLVAFKKVKLLAPPTDCLSPIEDLLIKKGLSKAIDSKFVSTVTRSPSVAGGNPFQVEVGLIFGTDLPSDSPVEVLRVANRVPLMYQQGGCLLTKSIESVDWKKYGLEHPGGRGVPKGPAAILVHLASTHVQFTSEAKEALSDNEEVFNEIRLALQEVGRGLRNHKRKSKQREKALEKFELVNVILPEISAKCSAILGREEPDLAPVITSIMNAVFSEEMSEWDSTEKVTKCSIKLFNYTSRPRQYTILATWPEREGVEIVNENIEGRREARGLRKWKLETLQPSENLEISFSIDGLSKGDWTQFDVFFRGSGEIIGAMKLDEKILEEIRREEMAAIEEEMVAAEHVADEVMGSDIDDSKDLDSAELDEALNSPLGDVSSETTVVEGIEENGAEDSETLNREEITDDPTNSTRQSKLFEDKEWSGEE